MPANAQTKYMAPWPTVPGNNSTVILFTTHERDPGGGQSIVQPSLAGISGQQVDAIEVVFHRHNKASAANGLRLYAVDDTGAWRETDLKNDLDAPTIGSAAPRQVPVLSAGQEYRIFLDVSRYRGVRLEYTAGADNPEEWNGTIWAHIGVTAMAK